MIIVPDEGTVPDEASVKGTEGGLEPLELAPPRQGASEVCTGFATEDVGSV